jgi:hypothetical protein
VIIAQTIPVGKGQKNPLVDYAASLTFKPKKTTGASVEPAPGSYERFMGLLGKTGGARD